MSKKHVLVIGIGLVVVLVGALVQWSKGSSQPNRPAAAQKLEQSEKVGDNAQGASQGTPIAPKPSAAQDENKRSAVVNVPVSSTCTIEVTVTSDGNPVRGASVYAFEGSDVRLVPGVTSGEGRLSLAITCDGYRGVGASHKNFAPVRRQVASNEEQILLEVQEAGCIRGVIQKVGSPVSIAARVVAWPSLRPPSSKELIAALGGRAHPWIFEGIIKGNGDFEVCGLNDAESYTVVAGDVGWVVHERLENVSVGQSVALYLDRLYGSVLKVRDVDGNPLQLSDSILRPWSTQTHLHDDANADMLESSSREAILAGIRINEMALHADDVVFIYQSHRSELLLDEIGPIEVSYTVPGQKEQVFSVPLRPVAPELHESIQNLSVIPESGSLSLTLWGLTDDEQSFAYETETTVGFLVLRQDSGDEFLVKVLAGEIENGIYLCGEMPVGHYDASFRLTGGRHLFPCIPPTVYVEEGSGSSLLVELPSTGSLEIRVSGPRGAMWGRGIVVYASRQGIGDARYYLPHPPYVMGGLSPDVYRLSVLAQPYTDIGGVALEDTLVLAGERALVEVVLEDPKR